MENHQLTRYSETDLAQFKIIIEKKLAKAGRQLETLVAQLAESTANKESHSDWVDDSSNSTNIQLLDTMANRLRKYILDLKNALIRIETKSYGICILTGELIDKKRLLAVPTTTKSVAAKNSAASNKRQRTVVAQAKNVAKKKIISKVIKKNDPPRKKAFAEEDFDPEWEKEDNLLDGIEQLDLKEEELED